MHAASTQTVQFAKAYRTEQMRAAQRSRTPGSGSTGPGGAEPCEVS